MHMILQTASNKSFLEMQAESKLAACYKQNTILGDQIFDILQQNCRVLYYPLEDVSVGGFITHLKGETFVCINTSLCYEEQILSAAHALYHIWFDHREEMILTAALEETMQASAPCEQQANQFARALLLPQLLLIKEMHLHAMGPKLKDFTQVLKLARIFLVPFHTMVRRLEEIEAISQKTCLSFLNLDTNQILIWKKRLGLESIERTNKISLDRLVEYAASAYEQHQITFERLEYLLSLACMRPEDVGSMKPDKPQTPSDEEISKLMEM